ncbi:MAG: Uma2 family endonuclease [Saprospiraceae bacterium]
MTMTLDIAERLSTIQEYLDREDAAAVRHEFNNGTITEMAGGTVPHNLIKGRFYARLDQKIEQLGSAHAVLNSDTKIRIEAENRFVYPDAAVSDGAVEYYETPDGILRRDTIINPLLVIEVLSDGTREHDKTTKFDAYCTIPGFREYILIEPESVWVKAFYLHDPEKMLWRIQTLTDRNATLHLYSLDIDLSLDEIYRVLDKLPA